MTPGRVRLARPMRSGQQCSASGPPSAAVRDPRARCAARTTARSLARRRRPVFAFPGEPPWLFEAHQHGRPVTAARTPTLRSGVGRLDRASALSVAKATAMPAHGLPPEPAWKLIDLSAFRLRMLVVEAFLPRDSRGVLCGMDPGARTRGERPSARSQLDGSLGAALPTAAACSSMHAERMAHCSGRIAEVHRTWNVKKSWADRCHAFPVLETLRDGDMVPCQQ